jgi:hypothetical protein
MSTMSYGRSESYLGMSKFVCHCGEFSDLWRSGTAENPGRLFVKCGLEKVCSYIHQLIVCSVRRALLAGGHELTFLVSFVEMQVLEVGGRALLLECREEEYNCTRHSEQAQSCFSL